MKRLRGFHADRLRRLLQGGAGRTPQAHVRGPHIDVPPPAAAHRPGGRDRLLATLERWSRLDAVLPEELIRRGLVAMDLDLHSLGAAVRFDDRCYLRMRIYSCNHFEVLVLCWRSGQGSPIHDHGDSTCGVLVVHGDATETLFEPSPCGLIAPVRAHLIPQGTIGVSRARDIHALANLQSSGVDLVSLHVYSPPLAESRCYRLGETTLGGLDDLLDRRPAARDISI